MLDAIWYTYLVYFLWPIQDFFSKVLSIPPYQSACTGDCEQGRQCDCAVEALDEYWPFPQPRP